MSFLRSERNEKDDDRETMISHKSELFFSNLQTKDLTTRKHFLDELDREVDTDDFEAENNNHHDQSFLYPTLLRLAHECPFEDVRCACSKILSKLENGGIQIPKRKYNGPSKFIPTNECIQIDTINLETQSLFVDAFLMTGRLSHIHQILGYHIQYLSCFLNFEWTLMRGNGPVLMDWRYYIGIMGAARHQCSNLIELCEASFLSFGGDPHWLKSIDNVPKKLKKLNELNKLLAHQPWLITIDTIKEFFTGSSKEQWTVSELLHAIMILLHYQTLSGFVFGCGITAEIDMKKGHSLRLHSSGENSSGNESTPTKDTKRASSFTEENTTTTQVLFKKMQSVREENTNDDEAENLRQFKEVETNELNDGELNEVIRVNVYDQYVVDRQFHYEEFAKRDKKDIEVFRAHDYNWQEHGFSFVNRLCPEMGTLLDNKFQCSFNLTYNKMGDSYKDVDTSTFRVATWNYIHLIYGIYHDDYVYYEVNKLLEKPYKTYIKKVACFPEQITFLDYVDFYADFLPSEKVHINLLVLESRFQAVLLYASRVLMQYMEKR